MCNSCEQFNSILLYMLLEYMAMNGSYILLSENFVGEKLGSEF